MELLVRKVRFKDKNIKNIYQKCFPTKDRLPFNFMVFLSKFILSKFIAFYEDNKPIGFLYYNVSISHVFLMFLGVDPLIQSKGYGSKILSYIKNKYPKKCIITSFTPKNDNITKRRMNFYGNNGFKMYSYNMVMYFHKQKVMIANRNLYKFRFFIFMLLYSLLSCWVFFYKAKEG